MTEALPIPLVPEYDRTKPGPPGAKFCTITANLLFNWLAAGNFESSFYDLPECPAWLTRHVVERWRKEREIFAEQFARARAYGAETLIKRAEDVLLNANKRDEIYKARELAGLYWKRANRLNPRDWGEKLEVDVSGTIEHKAVTLAPEWLQKAIADRAGETIEHEPDPESQ